MYVYFNITILPTKFVLLSISVWPLIWLHNTAAVAAALALFFSADYFPFSFSCSPVFNFSNTACAAVAAVTTAVVDAVHSSPVHSLKSH